MSKPPTEERPGRPGRGRGPAALAAVLCAAGSVLAACSPEPGSATAVAAAAARPNVLIAVFDTTRADRCGPWGYERGTTPYLDALARESTVYLNAWSPAGWTAPAHGSLLTGLRPEHHGAWLGGGLFLQAEQTTLPEWFSEVGYRTACITANPLLCPEFGLLQGFGHVDLRYEDVDPPMPMARESGRRLLEWIGSGSGPWFALVNYCEPHLSYDPPEEDAAPFLPPGVSARKVEELRLVSEHTALAHNIRARTVGQQDQGLLSDLYDAEIATMDREFGRIVEALRRSGTLDDTLLVVVGDHGENLGEHGLMSHHHSLHATVRRVPLLIRYPARFGAGAVERRTVRVEDVAPTVLEVCGLDVPGELDAASLLADLDDRIARAVLGPSPEDVLARMRTLRPTGDFGHLAHGFRAVFDGRFHLVVSADGVPALYDLQDDPGETHDLARIAVSELRRLEGLLPIVD